MSTITTSPGSLYKQELLGGGGIASTNVLGVNTNGGVDGFCILANGVIEDATLTVGSASVIPASYVAPVTLTIGVYKNLYGSKSLVGNLNFVINNPNVSSNTSSSTFQTSVLNDVNISINQGDIIGCEFSGSTTSSGISQVQGLELTLFCYDGAAI